MTRRSDCLGLPLTAACQGFEKTDILYSKYKYTCLWFSEHYDLLVIAKALSLSASRAVCVLIAMQKAAGYVTISCFRIAILEYASAIRRLE